MKKQKPSQIWVVEMLTHNAWCPYANFLCTEELGVRSLALCEELNQNGKFRLRKYLPQED